MNRKLSAIALLATFSVALSPSIASADDASRCASLANQWKAAKISKATNSNLARAKVWAKSAAHDCAKDSDSHRADGVSEYLEALKSLGVTPK